MAIDRIPGVGPSNADIATAVAAPSAATIAAAVAAPSAATIAAAVAAPSSATIASAVAAAVPTLAQINTSVSTNAPSPNAWVWLGSGNLQSVSGVTVSFSAYKKLKIIFRIYTGGTAQNIHLSFNNDTSSDAYFSRNLVWTPNGSAIPATSDYTPSTRLYLTSNANQAAGYYTTGVLEVESANLTTWKPVYGKMHYYDGTGGQKYSEIMGSYVGTSAITSIRVFDNGANNFNANAMNTSAFQVYGMN